MQWERILILNLQEEEECLCCLNPLFRRELLLLNTSNTLGLSKPQKGQTNLCSTDLSGTSFQQTGQESRTTAYCTYCPVFKQDFINFKNYRWVPPAMYPWFRLPWAWGNNGEHLYIGRSHYTKLASHHRANKEGRGEGQREQHFRREETGEGTERAPWDGPRSKLCFQPTPDFRQIWV